MTFLCFLQLHSGGGIRYSQSDLSVHLYDRLLLSVKVLQRNRTNRLSISISISLLIDLSFISIPIHPSITYLSIYLSMYTSATYTLNSSFNYSKYLEFQKMPCYLFNSCMCYFNRRIFARQKTRHPGPSGVLQYLKVGQFTAVTGLHGNCGVFKQRHYTSPPAIANDLPFLYPPASHRSLSKDLLRMSARGELYVSYEELQINFPACVKNSRSSMIAPRRNWHLQ